jgi:hypothetical protein
MNAVQCLLIVKRKLKIMVQKINTFENAAIGHHEDVLNDIHTKAKNIAVYQRDVAVLSEKLKSLANQHINCRASGTVEEILSTVDKYFDDHHLEYPDLFADVSQLIALFEKVTKAATFRLMLATIDSNMCSRFHTDINNLRLLCTYIGPGTLWLPNQAVNYNAVKTRGSNEEMVTDQQLIQQVSAGDVTILKGALYPDANPVLHKSPSIENSGQKRLLLRIDTNDSANLWG